MLYFRTPAISAPEDPIIDEFGRGQVALKLTAAGCAGGSDGAQDGGVALAAASAERDGPDAATATLQLV